MKLESLFLMAFSASAIGAYGAMPEDCTRLAYIQSTGVEYIDTGIRLQSPSDRVYMAFMCTTVGEGGTLFGSRVNASSKCFYAHYNNYWTGDGFSVNVNDSNFDGNRWTNATSGGLSFLNQLMEIDASIDSITVSRSGTPYPFTPKNRDSFETAGTCTVLKGVCVEGGSLGNKNGVIGRLYAFQIRRDGRLILDLIPAKKGESVGLYDAVSEGFFENASGQGGFTAGPEVHALTIADESGKLVGDPAVGCGLDPTNGEEVVCRAGGTSNVIDNVRCVPAGCILETYDFAHEAWGSAVTNEGASSFTYVQGGVFPVRLTWLAKQESRLRVGAFSNGVLRVNGNEIQPPSEGPRALPPGCVAVDYIQSTGEEYIDTGIRLQSPSDRVYMAFMCTRVGEGGTLFGSRVNASSKCFYAHYNNYWTGDGFSVNVNDSNFDGNRWTNATSGGQDFLNQLMEIDASIDSITVSRSGTSYPFTPKNRDSFETAGTCTVLKGVCVEGGSLGNKNGVIGRLYAFRIVRNGVTLLDLVPVSNNGTPCMYDRVSGGFFGNVGAGRFTAGPESAPEICTDLWFPKDSIATLSAQSSDGFLSWAGDVSADETLRNPLEKTMVRGLAVTPVFARPKCGLILLFR